MPDTNKFNLWKQKGLTLTDRVGHPPAVERDGISEEDLEESLERGDLAQKARLRFYPSIEVEFDELYTGSVSLDFEQLEEKLFDMGYRNNPTAYVEVTDKFGPDDGSYARQRIVEDDDFPYLGFSRPFGLVTWWNRLKLQVHATVFIDENRDLIHILSHWEASAWFQPVRHLTVSEASARIGKREFRERWLDEHGEELPKPME